MMRFVFILFAASCLGVGLPGCGDGGLAADPEALAALEELRAEQQRQPLLSAESYARLHDLARRFPGAPALHPLLEREYLLRREHHALIELLAALPQPTRDQELLLVDTLIKQSRHREAYERLQPLLRGTPDDPDVLWMAGYTAFHCDLYDQAIAHFDRDRAGLLAAGHHQALALRALLHLHAGELDAAESLVSEAVAGAPESLVARNAQGRILWARGETEAAAAAFTELERLEVLSESELRRQHLSISLMREIQDAWEERRYAEIEELVVKTVPLVPVAKRRQLFELMVKVFEATGRPAEAREMRRKLNEVAERGTGP